MDVLLYAFVLNDVRARVRHRRPHERPPAGAAACGLRGRRRAVRLARRPRRPHAGAHGVDPRLLVRHRGLRPRRSVWQLAPARLLVGLGMGGEWATGAALVAETWPAEHRGKALGLMQSAWAVGYAAAAGAQRDRATPVGLARRVLRRPDARAVHALDSPLGRRVAALAGGPPRDRASARGRRCSPDAARG